MERKVEHQPDEVSGAVAIVGDSHSLVRAGLKDVLRRRFGFQSVSEARSLAEVMDLVDRLPHVEFACIDLAMPGVVGVASLTALRNAFPSLRLAVTSGSDDREDILAALGAGVHGFIPKTYEMPQVTEALRTILDGNIFVPPVLANAASEVRPTRPGDAAARAHGVAALSRRQLDVLNLLACGRTNREISAELRLADGTVKVHVQAILRALGVKNRAGAVAAITNLRRAAE